MLEGGTRGADGRGWQKLSHTAREKAIDWTRGNPLKGRVIPLPQRGEIFSLTMSEENKTQPTPPPVPSAKTSAVPLKKETVRITLRARPGAGVTQPKEFTAPVPSPGTAPVPRAITTSVTPAGAATARVPTSPVLPVSGASKATAPIQLPSAPLPPPAARASTTQVHLPPRPPGAPAAPPRPPGAPPPLMAPTVPLAKVPAGGIRPPGAPKPPGMTVEAGAATVPLAKTPGAPKPPVQGAPVAPRPGPTQLLPKATVQLAKGTTPLAKQGSAAAPSGIAATRGAEEEEFYEEKDPEAGLAPLAVACLFLALALMGFNLLGTDKAFFAEKGSESPFMVPAADDPAWEQKQPDGTHKSTFSTKLDEIAKKLK